MKSGTCPKCGSEEVYRGGSINSLVLQTHTLAAQPAKLYVCVDCGYTEQYAMPGHDLSQLKERFEKVKS